MKGWKYRVPRCRVCGREAFSGTQSRPLCLQHELLEKEQKLDYCCQCGSILANVPTEWKGFNDLLCVDCMDKINYIEEQKGDNIQ